MRLGLQSWKNKIRFHSHYLCNANREIYLGYVGRYNFGDDLLFDIYSKVTDRNPVPALDLFESLSYPLKANVVLGGGTIINGSIYLKTLEQLGKKPIHTFCSGVIGDRLSPEWCEMLSETKVFTRSEESALVCRKDGIDAKPIVDPGIYTSLLYKIDTNIRKPYAILAPHGNYPKISIYESILNHARKNYNQTHIVFFVSSPADKKLCKYLSSIYKNSSVFYKPNNLESSISLIANASYVISTRLHAAVVAASFGVPYKIVKYAEKQSEFTNSIGEKDVFMKSNEISDITSLFSLPPKEQTKSTKFNVPSLQEFRKYFNTP